MTDEYFEITGESSDDDKYSRLKGISWWDQERLHDAHIMIVGAGAIGNELIKNLALLGIGNLYIIDMDRIENSNLTRSVLYRSEDIGKYKANVAAERAMEINKDTIAHAFVANVIDDIGLGMFRQMDVVLGGLDNREARMHINQACYKVGVTWIDGAIEALNGFARVFSPKEGACYECTMTEMDWQLLNKRRSCALLTNEQLLEGKVPTTPTSSAIIAGVQVQEMLKILHGDKNLPVLYGKGFVFNGFTHDSYIAEYTRKPDCLCHDSVWETEEQSWASASMKISEVLAEIRKNMGQNTVIDLDREIITKGICKCGSHVTFNIPAHKLTGEMLMCDNCGTTMQYDSTHTINGSETFFDMTFEEIGIPPLHIVSARNGSDIRYYEFTDDNYSGFFK